ncbi:MAG: hypothetical protein ACJ77Z_17420 [Thermoleophilaceae bacterium]
MSTSVTPSAAAKAAETARNATGRRHTAPASAGSSRPPATQHATSTIAPVVESGPVAGSLSRAPSIAAAKVAAKMPPMSVQRVSSR